MNKLSLKKFWWFLTVFYLIITYASLGIMPALWRTIDRFLGGRALLAQYVVYACIWLGFLTYLIFIRRERSLRGYFLFTLFTIAFLCIIQLQPNPGEKIHLAQYGLLGVLVYNALRIDIPLESNKWYLYAIIFCFLAGAVDEVIQGFLPNRYFTWRDVLVNGLSGTLILSVIKFNILARRSSSSAAFR